MQAKATFSLLCLLWMSSCAIYSPTFDCPPGKGVPCTSVSNIEKMIVETEYGPDIFLAADLQNDCDKLETLGKTIPRCSKECSRRKIWVEEHVEEDGSIVEGHYMYLSNGYEG